MKVLYRSLRFFFIALILIVAASSYAQEKNHTAEVNQNKSSAILNNRTKIIDPYIKVRSRAERSVSLAWMAYTGDVSQYVLERSVDGKKYQEVSVIVSVNNEEPYFEFTDRFKSPYAGPLYYRLRVEGLDGGAVYAPGTILYAAQ
jgi:hypothetical protein